jgi:hypothetical protein
MSLSATRKSDVAAPWCNMSSGHTIQFVCRSHDSDMGIENGLQGRTYATRS